MSSALVRLERAAAIREAAAERDRAALVDATCELGAPTPSPASRASWEEADALVSAALSALPSDSESDRRELAAALRRSVHAGFGPASAPTPATIAAIEAWDTDDHLVEWRLGSGQLTLHCEVESDVSLSIVREIEGRLRAGPEVALGSTPLRDLPIGSGSYLLRFDTAGRAEVVLPVCVGRGAFVSFRRPGEAAPAKIHLPMRGELRADEIYVPSGPAWVGGDGHESPAALSLREVFLEGFAARRFPVTCGEYLGFLAAQYDRDPDEGRRAHPRRAVPRRRRPAAPR